MSLSVWSAPLSTVTGGFIGDQCGHASDLYDFLSSSWLRPVKGPAEELWQAAAGCPPVSKEPDQPGKEVLL